jgi:hypothetical protein
MKSLFSLYGTSGVVRLPLYTSGTENVSWVKGIDTQTGSGFGTSANTYTEGGSYITLKIVNEPTGFITSELSSVTNNHVDIDGYKRACVDWEVISAGTFALIVDDTKNGDIDNIGSKVTYGAGTGRKVSSVAINSLGVANYHIRVHAYAITTAPDTEEIEIRIHKVWLEK